MKIFLTGATGFIGQALVQTFLAKGWQVLALVRNPKSAAAQTLLDLGAECIKGDILDKASMREGISAADVVVHNAGMYEYGVNAKGRQRMYDINVTGADNVFSLALELGVKRVVHISSTFYWGTTGNEFFDETSKRQHPYSNWYEQTKAEAHELALQYYQKGLPIVLACPSQVIGPNDHSPFGYFMRMYLSGLMTPFAWSPEVEIAFVHLDDLARGVALVVEKGRIGEAYMLAGHCMSKKTYMGYWAKHPGGMKVSFYIPRWLAKLMFWPVPPLLRMLGLSVFISPEAVNADLPYKFSGAKAQKELGWSIIPVEIMWQDVLEKEAILLQKPSRKGLIAKLNPL